MIVSDAAIEGEFTIDVTLSGRVVSKAIVGRLWVKDVATLKVALA